MSKKEYQVPTTSLVTLQTESIIASSGPGAEIPDVGWGSSERLPADGWSSDTWCDE